MKSFEIVWQEVEIEALRRTVSLCSLPDSAPGTGWELGCDRDFLERFRSFWVADYDWRSALAALNRYPQFLTEIDGQLLHFVHVKGEGTNPLALTLGSCVLESNVIPAWDDSRITFEHRMAAHR